jgi:hypothetical protein
VDKKDKFIKILCIKIFFLKIKNKPKNKNIKLKALFIALI